MYLSLNKIKIILFLLYYRMMSFKKSHILKLSHNGKLLINVVDNLIVVHYQHTKVFIFFKLMVFMN